MSKVLPFAAFRPNKDVVSEVAALPYDVYKRAEAKAFVDEHPKSFLRIDMNRRICMLRKFMIRQMRCCTMT